MRFFCHWEYFLETRPSIHYKNAPTNTIYYTVIILDQEIEHYLLQNKSVSHYHTQNLQIQYLLSH